MTAVRSRALAPAKRTSTYRRKPHTRTVRGRVVAVRQSKPIARMGRAVQAVRVAPTASYAYGQSILAPGPRREQAKFAAKLGASAGVATAVGVGQVASVTVSVLAAVAVCVGVAAWYVTRKVEPKRVRKFREKSFRFWRGVRAELRHGWAVAGGAYTGTRKRTAVRRPAPRPAPVFTAPKPAPKPQVVAPPPKTAAIPVTPRPNPASIPDPEPAKTPTSTRKQPPKETPMFGWAKPTPAEKTTALRAKGWKGAIDQDGNKVKDVDKWIADSRARTQRDFDRKYG